MKSISKMGAQGDCLFIRVDRVPDGYQPSKDRVIAHSETGHHHLAVGDYEVLRRDGDLLTAYMVARGPVQIRHHRSWDTHETMELLDGGEPEVVWEIRRAREQTPDGWKRVED